MNCQAPGTINSLFPLSPFSVSVPKHLLDTEPHPSSSLFFTLHCNIPKSFFSTSDLIQLNDIISTAVEFVFIRQYASLGRSSFFLCCWSSVPFQCGQELRRCFNFYPPLFADIRFGMTMSRKKTSLLRYE